MQSETKSAGKDAVSRFDALGEPADPRNDAFIVWVGIAVVVLAPAVGLALGLAIWGWPHG